MIETSLPDNNKMHLTSDISALHQRSASITSTLHQPSVKVNPLPTNMRDEPQLQYFDLDVANPPTVNRQSIGCNLTKQDSNKPDLLSKGPPTSGVVYNSVDFLKTEAFKRIREERKKESEGVGSK
uniref:Protein daughter of sevenless n=2 Tax=Ceratitis capitata TaxID=7213 RepID=W8C8T4_CERCA